ncbi:MAG: dCMP deaminase family protein [Alishewanella agri]|nr:dCMP deaminase family protein [Alishewanella agri]
MSNPYWIKVDNSEPVFIWPHPYPKKWCVRWLNLAKTVADWSKDPSTKVGAAIFRLDNTPISFGYNGLPRNIKDTDERLQNREVKYKLTVHAEANAILNAAKSGASLNGAVIAVTHPPCPNCAAMIIQAGIQGVLVPEVKDFERWDPELSFSILKEAGVQVITI